MDSKGRLLIPNHIRKMLDIKDGTEIVLIPDKDTSCVKLMLLPRENTLKMKFLIKDKPGALAYIANFLSKYNFNIVMSESRSIVKDEVAEWDVIIDTSKATTDIEKLRDVFEQMDIIENVMIIK